MTCLGIKKSEKNGVAHHVHFDLPKIEIELIEGILNSYEKHKHILMEISKAPSKSWMAWHTASSPTTLQGGRSMIVLFLVHNIIMRKTKRFDT